MLWEHAPVRENCLNCHESHGSNHDKLLVAALRHALGSAETGYRGRPIPGTPKRC